ncbi:MerR family transcriptional regulator [Kibdelosporangium philippinense]
MPAMLGLDVDMKSSETFGVGQVAERFGLAAHVLRHWESEGLLQPERDGDRRRYRQGDLDRVALIRKAKEAGFSLAEIREMFVVADPAMRKEIMRHHQQALIERIAELQASLTMVETALNCAHEDITECPNFRRELVRLARTLAH